MKKFANTNYANFTIVAIETINKMKEILTVTFFVLLLFLPSIFRFKIGRFYELHGGIVH